MSLNLSDFNEIGCFAIKIDLLVEKELFFTDHISLLILVQTAEVIDFIRLG
jgi:hypothetical protein